MLTLAFFGAIVVATALLGRWAGVIVLLLLSAGAVWWIAASRRSG